VEAQTRDALLPSVHSYTTYVLHEDTSHLDIALRSPPHLIPHSPLPLLYQTSFPSTNPPPQSSKTTSPTCTDACMDYPKDWETTLGQQNSSGPNATGHEEQGRTVVLHSVAIAPGFQNRGMGGVLMKSYVASIVGAGVADRFALLAHEVCFSDFFGVGMFGVLPFTLYMQKDDLFFSFFFLGNLLRHKRVIWRRKPSSADTTTGKSRMVRKTWIH
jgi:hypothetical protein